MEQFDNWEEFDNYKEYEAIIDFAHYAESNIQYQRPRQQKTAVIFIYTNGILPLAGQSKAPFCL